MKHLSSAVLLWCLGATQAWAASPPPAEPVGQAGVPVAFDLPASGGTLPSTYLVTLAVVDPKNPDWIISTFVAGEPRTVTAENKGHFTEKWNGLDENFMPVPPGTYAVKGIYMPAQRWPVDGQWHAITPRYAGGISAWMPPTDAANPKILFGGDPVGSPMRDVAVGPNGVAVFYYQYLENGTNSPMFDLKKPVGPDQFLRAFNSGGAAGGPCVATDGETVWAASSDGGPKFLYRTDGKSFGSSPNANRRNACLVEGVVTAMAAWRDPAAGKSCVYVAEGAKYVATEQRKGNIVRERYSPSETEFVDKIFVHAGDDGKELAALTLPHPQGLAVLGGKLYALHAEGSALAVSACGLNGGVPNGQWQRVFAVPESIKPFDLEVDSHGRFYLSDPEANKVFQLDAKGKVLRSFGRLAAQKSGTYDRETLMAPEKLATWRDDEGKDRLIVVEMAGPNRTSEWSAEDGSLLREFTSYQTNANDGYAVDEEHPEQLYVPGHRHWLVRFKTDYDKHTWTVDAVWPDVGNDPKLPGLTKPLVIRTSGRIYLAGGRSRNVYRLDGDRWVLSAGIVEDAKHQLSLWHDANGNGRVDDEELTPTSPGRGVVGYHGQNWSPDLSYLAINQGTTDVLRLSPGSFDEHGNPIFAEWKKVTADPTFTARVAGKADAVHGGNELGNNFNCAWAQADETPGGDLYIQARSGKDFDANEGAQYKVSRYVPGTDGGYVQKWRVGRAALKSTAKRGEMYGGMRIRRPINGLVSIIDQSRCGVLLYTEDGMYVDTLFPDLKQSPDLRGSIYELPGEFFAGIIYPNKDNGRVYIGVGKYTPELFEVEGWSLRDNPVKPLTTVQKSVTINSSQTAAPSEMALSLRGGAGKAQVTRFGLALGGVALDGSMSGWEAAEPVSFAASKDQTVEVRCLYDPDHLYLRWHATVGGKFEPRPLPPLERIFTHDQLADTLSFYIQGDPKALPAAAPGGRAGDARFAFGLFKNGDAWQPVGVGFYPSWPGGGQKQVYRTIVRQTNFAHVGTIQGVKLGYAVDPDGKGFVLAAAIPRAAIPAMRQTAFNGDLRTLVDFEATFAGHNKFWWANSDGTASTETYDEPSEAGLYPSAWAPAIFQGLENGVTVRKWMTCGPFGGNGAEAFSKNPGQQKEKEDVQKFFEQAVFPPDSGVADTKEIYEGEMTQGYWGKPGKVAWKPATVADLDTRVIMGQGGQVWYGTTWIYSPAATQVNVEFQQHRMTKLRWFVNGKRLEFPKVEEKIASNAIEQTVALQPGWNQILVRGYCFGYAPFRAGIVLKDAPEKLWPLRLSGTPPADPTL